MNIENLTTIESLDHFLQGSQDIAFSVLGEKVERYQFTQKDTGQVRLPGLFKEGQRVDYSFPGENDRILSSTNYAVNQSA